MFLPGDPASLATPPRRAAQVAWLRPQPRPHHSQLRSEGKSSFFRYWADICFIMIPETTPRGTRRPGRGDGGAARDPCPGSVSARPELPPTCQVTGGDSDPGQVVSDVGQRLQQEAVEDRRLLLSLQDMGQRAAWGDRLLAGCSLPRGRPAPPDSASQLGKLRTLSTWPRSWETLRGGRWAVWSPAVVAGHPGP